MWKYSWWIGEMGAAPFRICSSISSTFRKQCHFRPNHISWYYVPRENEVSHLYRSQYIPSLPEYAMAHGSGEKFKQFKLERVIIVSRCTCNAIALGWMNDEKFFTNWELDLSMWKKRRETDKCNWMVNKNRKKGHTVLPEKNKHLLFMNADIETSK